MPAVLVRLFASIGLVAVPAPLQILGGVLAFIWKPVAWLLKQFALGCRDVGGNFRIWIVVGVAVFGGMALGRHFTWEQAYSDANTLRQEAEIYNAQADAARDAAANAARNAVKAEEKRIEAEKRAADIIVAAEAAEAAHEKEKRDAAEAKAVADAKAKAPTPKRRNKSPVTDDWFTTITGGLKP